MSVESPFQPMQGANKKVTATTTSANVTIGAGQKSLRIINAGAVLGYFRTYRASEGAQTATAADTPIAVSGAAGSVLVIEKPEMHDTIAHLSDATTTVLHFQPGEGGC